MFTMYSLIVVVVVVFNLAEHLQIKLRDLRELISEMSGGRRRKKKLE